MTASFLLRFQEPCDDWQPATAATGTQTITKIAHEQSDADPTIPLFRAMPEVEEFTGTVTNNRIRAEQGDAALSDIARTVPIHSMMGTTTKTAVKMESDDQDPRQHELTVLPRCSSY